MYTIQKWTTWTTKVPGKPMEDVTRGDLVKIYIRLQILKLLYSSPNVHIQVRLRLCLKIHKLMWKSTLHSAKKKWIYFFLYDYSRLSDGIVNDCDVYRLMLGHKLELKELKTHHYNWLILFVLNNNLKDVDLLYLTKLKIFTALLTLVFLRGLQQPPNSFRPGAQNRTAKG